MPYPFGKLQVSLLEHESQKAPLSLVAHDSLILEVGRLWPKEVKWLVQASQAEGIGPIARVLDFLFTFAPPLPTRVVHRPLGVYCKGGISRPNSRPTESKPPLNETFWSLAYARESSKHGPSPHLEEIIEIFKCALIVKITQFFFPLWKRKDGWWCVGRGRRTKMCAFLESSHWEKLTLPGRQPQERHPLPK